MCIELQADPKRENYAWCNNTPFTANHVSHRERENRAKESSSRENGYLSNKANTQMKKITGIESARERQGEGGWDD